MLSYDLYFYSSSYNSLPIWLDGQSGPNQNVSAIPNNGQMDIYSGDEDSISSVKFGSGGTDSNINVFPPLAP